MDKDTTPQSATTATQDRLALTARILISAIFILAGANKLFEPAATIGYIQSVGMPLPQIAYGGAVVIELVGGLAILAGFKTRPVAYALAGFSILTALVFHNQIADQTQFVMFFKNLGLAGGFLLLAAFGPGRLSIDKG